MGIVNLVSGGLDSTLVGVLLKEEGVPTYPLFVDYGQRASEREWNACLAVHNKYGLPRPERVDLAGYGKLILSGLTTESKHVKDEAFTPGRNFLFILVGAAYAYQVGANAVSIGLLSQRYSLFPDQRKDFVEAAEQSIRYALNKDVKVVTPLFEFSKADVIALAKQRGIVGTYSCHEGKEKPCGHCISCLEVGGNKAIS